MFWVVVLAMIFMQVYMSLGAKLGAVSGKSVGDLIALRFGRATAALLGLSVFFISAAFQFGNNLGVHSAFQVYAQPEAGLIDPQHAYLFSYVVVAFNALSIAFVFGFRNLYRALERLMMVFVGMMLVSFAANLGFALWAAPPSVAEFASGFVPQGHAVTDLAVLGLVGTTFVMSAALYQAYLVRQKGWDVTQVRDGLLDARVGAVIMALITLMIMGTAATVLRGQTLNNVADVAQQLRPLFGEKGQALFCLGLFSAAYSSFLINSLIGGFVLSDTLGLGSKPDDRWPRLFTLAVLLTGMCVALYVIFAKWNPVPAIVAAQAVTVLAAPAVAIALWYLTSRRDVMGEQRNRPGTNLLAGIGLLILLMVAAYTAPVKIPERVQAYRNPPAAAVETEQK